jgi:hypothetical protein
VRVNSLIIPTGRQPSPQSARRMFFSIVISPDMISP